LLRRGRQSVDLVNRWLGSQVEFADQVDMNDQVRIARFPNPGTHCFTSNAGDCSDRLL